MSTIVVETVSTYEALDLMMALQLTQADHGNAAMCVRLPDGRDVRGYQVEQETLTDGSVVYNIVLRAEG